MKKKLFRDPIASFERETRAARRVGNGNRCSKCGEDRPLALIRGSKPVICAACKRQKNGQSPFDKHHPAGVANHPATVAVPINDHRADLSVSQYDWPEETFHNPSGSPMLAGAASIRGYCDTTDYLKDHLLVRNAKLFEDLDRFLTRKLGPNWWRGTEIEKYALKRKPKS